MRQHNNTVRKGNDIMNVRYRSVGLCVISGSPSCCSMPEALSNQPLSLPDEDEDVEEEECRL